jgi:hypothetical protein
MINPPGTVALAPVTYSTPECSAGIESAPMTHPMAGQGRTSRHCRKVASAPRRVKPRIAVRSANGRWSRHRVPFGPLPSDAERSMLTRSGYGTDHPETVVTRKPPRARHHDHGQRGDNRNLNTWEGTGRAPNVWSERINERSSTPFRVRSAHGGRRSAVARECRAPRATRARRGHAEQTASGNFRRPKGHLWWGPLVPTVSNHLQGGWR